MLMKPSSPFPSCCRTAVAVVLLALLLRSGEAELRAADRVVPRAEPWEAEYEGGDVDGPAVLGHWKFSSDGPAVDASTRKNPGKLDGAAAAEGRFGGGLRSAPGYPKSDARHALLVDNAPHLSPSGPFSLELWLNPSEQFAEVYNAYLVDKKYVAHTDYQWTIERGGGPTERRMRLTLGFGDASDTVVSQPIAITPGTWTHLAVAYDGRGTARFFQDGSGRGEPVMRGRGAIVAGAHGLSIGDRLGSNYAGVPGVIDEVRITAGPREFAPLAVSLASPRRVFRRMENIAPLAYRVENRSSRPVEGLEVAWQIPGLPKVESRVARIEPLGTATVEFPFDTAWRPGEYRLMATVTATAFPGREFPRAETLRIMARLPDRMPVLNWGLHGFSDLIAEMPRLRDLGFTHTLGLDANAYVVAKHTDDKGLAIADAMLPEAARTLDAALAADLDVCVSLYPAQYLDTTHTEWKRVDRQGKKYPKIPGDDLNGLVPEAQAFCRKFGAAVGRTYGTHPAFDSALIHSELRDHSWLSFAEIDRAEYRKATGREIPAEAQTPYGVPHTTIADFPKDRVVPDDHPILTYYKWFHADGHGLGRLNTAVAEGLRSQITRPDFWTFFDPAVRCPSVWGSGGQVDVLSQWTYSYPDPIRIALPTDELFAMAKGRDPAPRVMKMTQVIWYRSQTAPSEKPGDPQGVKTQRERSPWEDQDPTGQYITIAPMHLREAFWTKLSRPIQGIMYHGWSSLVETAEPSAYRFTHPETQHELRRLVKEVIEPLGPSLKRIPAAPRDVAFLESFASEVFAGRGSYGWSHGWRGDLYLALQYAQLQPEVVYEESVIRDGLDRFQVLVVADGDVLTASVAAKIRDFQKRGGIVVADTRLCPAITPDIVLTPRERSKDAKEAKTALLEVAQELRGRLDAKYRRAVESSDPDVITALRRSDKTDYVFAINDKREFGRYVGSHKLVMEAGLPARTVVRIAKPKGAVYDPVGGTRLSATERDGGLDVPLELSPGEGRLLMVVPSPLSDVRVSAPGEVSRGGECPLEITIADETGNAVPGVVPVLVEIRDPDGRVAEGTGYHAAEGGVLRLNLAIAANDTPGAWDVRVTELASKLSSRGTFRVVE
jgi:hypothetical protein